MKVKVAFFLPLFKACVLQVVDYSANGKSPNFYLRRISKVVCVQYYLRAAVFCVDPVALKGGRLYGMQASLYKVVLFQPP